jgi:hypothetical protein
MHALLLSLALGQAAPDAAVPADHPAEPAPSAIIVPAARSLRAIDFTRLPDGSFRAALDGQPVAGADFYRAVLRPDLAARTEEARASRTALLVGAVVAPLAGLGIGWVAGTAQQWPLPPCTRVPPGPLNCQAHDQVAAQNQSVMTRALLLGGAVGLTTGAVLALAGTSIRPPEPTADEAEALVRAYRARAAADSTPAPAALQPGDATLRLEAAPGAARLALRVAF